MSEFYEETNTTHEENDLNQDLQIEQLIKDAITLAILNNESHATIDGRIAEIDLDIYQIDKDDDTYQVDFDEDTTIARVKRTSDGVKFDFYNSDIQKNFSSEFDWSFAINAQRKEHIMRREIQRGKDAKDLKLEGRDRQSAMQEELNQKLKAGKANKIEIDREFSNNETMRMFLKRVWKIDATELYRVQDGHDMHSCKYVAKTHNSKESLQELDISAYREGHNPKQKVMVFENGEIKEKTFDNLMLKGNYGIAYDFQDSVMSGHNKSYLVSRVPGVPGGHGEGYLAIPLEEKSGVNRNLKSDMEQKNAMSKTETIWDIEELIRSAQLAEKIGALTKDKKLTTGEVSMVRELRQDLNLNDEEVIDTINAVSVMHECGLSETQIKKSLDNFREVPKNPKAMIKVQQDLKGKDLSQEEKEETAKTMFDGYENGPEHKHGHH